MIYIDITQILIILKAMQLMFLFSIVMVSNVPIPPNLSLMVNGTFCCHYRCKLVVSRWQAPVVRRRPTRGIRVASPGPLRVFKYRV